MINSNKLNTPHIEHHPLMPFLPKNAKILMLGSFPPSKTRWSIDFFYPNYQNDMWRIMGLLFFHDKNHFCIIEEKRFNYQKILDFCKAEGIAIFDTARSVKRLKNNASDKYLEIVTPTDIKALLKSIPRCKSIVTTGEKASSIVAKIFNTQIPKVGTFVEIPFENSILKFWRMPSSSRAYPLALEKKASFYKYVFNIVD
ncbi:MAG: uracil-DNA glycosylase family protein [Bacteroidales bacterium]